MLIKFKRLLCKIGIHIPRKERNAFKDIIDGNTVFSGHCSCNKEWLFNHTYKMEWNKEIEEQAKEIFKLNTQIGEFDHSLNLSHAHCCMYKEQVIELYDILKQIFNEIPMTEENEKVLDQVKLILDKQDITKTPPIKIAKPDQTFLTKESK